MVREDKEKDSEMYFIFFFGFMWSMKDFDANL